MKDDFIYRSLPKIRKDFAESLFAKISTGTSHVSQADMHQKLRRRKWLQAVLIMLGLFILVAWSQLRLWVRYVPIGDLWLVEFSKTTQDSQSDVPYVPTPLPTYDWTRTLTPEELFFSLYIPAWIPDGFEDMENLHDTMFWDSTIWMWNNEDGEDIRLFLEGKAGGMRPYAPQGMWKEVRVNGKPAILIYGRLALTSPDNPTATRKWDKSLGLQLYWDMGKYIYVLETYGPYVSEKDLIRMAESADELPRWPTPTP